MKLLCAVEKRLPGLKDMVFPQVKEFNKIETVEYLWDDPDVESITLAMGRIEANGPEEESLPQGYAENDDVEIVMTNYCPVSREGLSVLKNVRVVGVIRSGFENVNVAAATEKNVLVVNASGRNADAVSDFTVGLMLSEVRNIAKAHHSVKNGEWQIKFANNDSIPDLREKTIGLFGFGYIGKLVAEKLSGFHMKVIYYDPWVSPEEGKNFGAVSVSKEQLFTEADFISVHARLTEESKKAIGRTELESMKPTAYFINTARAGLVDYDALYELLRDHKIKGAGLDVFEKEPLDATDRFRALDNVTMTTHLAGYTTDAIRNSPRLIMRRLKNILLNDARDGVVNPSVLETPEFQEWKNKARAYFQD